MSEKNSVQYMLLRFHEHGRVTRDLPGVTFTLDCHSSLDMITVGYDAVRIYNSGNGSDILILELCNLLRYASLKAECMPYERRFRGDPVASASLEKDSISYQEETICPVPLSETSHSSLLHRRGGERKRTNTVSAALFGCVSVCDAPTSEAHQVRASPVPHLGRR